MLLNAAYWIVAALPARAHWDLEAFKIKKQRFEYNAGNSKHIYSDDDYEYDTDEEVAEKEKRKVKKMKNKADKTFTDLNPTFTNAMWKAIVATKSIAWVKKNDALPETPVWNEWLEDALKEAQKGDVTWATMENCSYPVKSYSVPDWEPLAHFYQLLEKHKRASTMNAEKEKAAIEVDGVEDPHGPASRRTTDLEQPQDQPFIPTAPRRQGTNLED